MAYSCQKKVWSSMTQPNNLSAIDKRVADAKQAETGASNQNQSGEKQKQVQPDQQNGPNQTQTGQNKPTQP